MTVTRTLKLLGETVGAAALAFDFASETEGGSFSRNSTYVPAPEEPLTSTGRFPVNRCFGMADIVAL